MRSGWVTARTMPAMALASTWREAKPTTAAAIALEASTVAASRSRLVNCARARAAPMTMIAASTTRRRKRRRVSSIGLSSAPPSASGSLCTRPRIARCTIATSTSAARSVSAAAIKRPDDESAATMRAVMAREGIPSAVLLDALGTLVELETPWPHLERELAARGVVVDLEAARTAMLAEMAYYRAHHDEARDWATLKDLRRRCAAVVQESLGTSLPLADVEDALLAAIRFRAYPEVPAALERLRAGGARLAVVSNWDVSLHDVLERTGLRGARRRRRHLGRARRGQARSGHLPRRAGPAGGHGRRRDARRRQRRGRRRRRARGGPARRCSSPATARRRPTACASWPPSTACSMT